MKVLNLKVNEGGTHDFDISLEQGEVEFLVNLALDYLVDKEYIDLNRKQDEFHIDLLNSLNPEEMFQA
jgi:hypothetical protein